MISPMYLCISEDIWFLHSLIRDFLAVALLLRGPEKWRFVKAVYISTYSIKLTSPKNRFSRFFEMVITFPRKNGRSAKNRLTRWKSRRAFWKDSIRHSHSCSAILGAETQNRSLRSDHRNRVRNWLASQLRDNASSTTVIQLEMIKLRIFEKLRIVSKKTSSWKTSSNRHVLLGSHFFLCEKSVTWLAYFTKIDWRRSIKLSRYQLLVLEKLILSNVLLQK